MTTEYENISMTSLLDEQDNNSHIRTFIIGLSVIIFGAIIWSMLTSVDEITQAPGVVNPKGHPQIIKHLEGGKIKTIFKGNGDYVKSNEIIVYLEPNRDVADRSTLLSRNESLDLEILRLEILSDKENNPLENLEEKLLLNAQDIFALNPQILVETVARIRKEFVAHDSRIGLKLEEVDIGKLAIEQFKKQVNNRKKRLKILTQANNIYNELDKTNEISKIKLIDAKEKYNETEADLLSIEAKLDEAKQLLDKNQQEVTAFEQNYTFDLLQQLSKAKANITEVQNALKNYVDQDENLSIKSTSDGYIQDFKFHIGSIIRPGEKILEIVPSDPELIIKAKISAKDIANIRVGSSSQLRVSSYNYIRYGSLEGEISDISASTFKDKDDGIPYYKVNIQLTSDIPANIKLIPGMTVTADVITGSRTVMQYILRPVLHSLSMAFKEH